MAPRPPSWSQARQFGIVIDAGSSGSRIQIYSWIKPEVARQQRKAAGLSLDVVSKVEKGVEHGEGWQMKIVPGLSTMGPTPDGVPAYLAPLLDFAASVIPASQLSSTPIYLLATAGMRLLPEDQQSAVLDATCSFIQKYPFKLDHCATNVRIITGEEEGLYGWIAVNYLMDGFDKHEHSSTGAELLRHASTYGFLDMGGASTQIAFEPSEEAQIAHADNLREVKLQLLSGKDVRHPVFVTTWLGFGTNQAKDRYVDSLIDAHTRMRVGERPNADEDKAASTIDDPCLPKSLMLFDHRHPGFTLRGTGDFSACVARTGPLLNKAVECLDEPCLFNGVHVPPIDFSVNHFIGISEYWYSTQDVWSMGGVYDFVEFERNAVEFCSREWNDIIADHKAGSKWRSSVELSRLESQCFKAAWIINILHEGIGIPRLHLDKGGEGDDVNQTEKGLAKAAQKGLLPPTPPPSFQSLNEVGDVAVSWTLGKMVLEVAKGATNGDTTAPVEPSSPLDDAWPLRNFPDEWKGHIPSWSGGFRETISSVKSNASPIPVFGLAAVLALLWFFCASKGSSRRRMIVVGTVLGHNRRNTDFALVSQEEGGNLASDSSSGGSRSPQSRARRASVSLANKVLSPLRYGAKLLSSSLRRWSSSPNSLSRNPSANGLLPTTLRPGSSPTESVELFRPRALRHTNSAPFMRVSSLGNLQSASSQTGSILNHWNDAPDLDAIRRSQSGTRLGQMTTSASSTSLSARVASPPPPPLPPTTQVIPPTPLSRPTTPGLRAPSGLSKLTPRTRESSAEDVARSASVNSHRSDVPLPGAVTPPAGVQQGGLAAAAWEALGEAGGAFDATSPGALSSAHEANSPPAISTPLAGLGPGGLVSSAKLRSSRSQNSSRADLSSGYFGRGAGAEDE